METMERDKKAAAQRQERRAEREDKNEAANRISIKAERKNEASDRIKKGRKRPRIAMLAGGFAAILLLSGCGTGVSAVDAHTPGFFNHYVVFPFSWLIDHFAGWFGGSFGLALIAVTVLIRMALLPIMMSQYKRQQATKRKMSAMQPEIDAVKRKYGKVKDVESQRKQQQETMAIYSKHGYNPLSLGCLPMLLQIPILSGLYFAIRATPELAQHTFLWFQLGSPDMIMPFVAAAVYFLQAKVTQNTTPAPGGMPAMGWMVYLSPVIMGFFSFSVPAALPLYWSVGGLIVVLQTMLAKRLYPPQTSLSTSQGEPADAVL